MDDALSEDHPRHPRHRRTTSGDDCQGNIAHHLNSTKGILLRTLHRILAMSPNQFICRHLSCPLSKLDGNNNPRSAGADAISLLVSYWLYHSGKLNLPTISRALPVIQAGNLAKQVPRIFYKILRTGQQSLMSRLCIAETVIGII